MFLKNPKGGTVTKRVFLIFAALFFGLNTQTFASAKKAVNAPPQVQKTEPQPSPAATELTVEQVIQLVQAGLSEDLIIAKIKKNNKAFDLSTDQLLQLKKAGASDNIIRVLMDPQAQPITAPVTPPAPAPAVETSKSISAVPAEQSGQRITAQRQRQIFITAKRFQSDETDFPDKTLLDSVDDLKRAAISRGFTVTDNETDAHLMLTVLERKTEQVRPSIWKHKTQRVEGILHCALWRKEGNEWKPAVKLRSQSLYWKDAAAKMIDEVDKWLNK